MIRSVKLPLLPGYCFSRTVGQTRFHKSTNFEYLNGLIPYLTEAESPGIGGYPVVWAPPDITPSIYPRRECKELPAWLVFDKQILAFEAYFQETMWEVDKCPFQIRKVKIYYFLEDGTIQVNEPKVDNSGMTQGVLISRQRIKFPKPMDNAFYDLIDFNIGKNVELFGRVFRIVNCDKFTRNFLNRMGIFVGDPLSYPNDPCRADEEKRKIDFYGKKPRTTEPSFGRYLEFDKKILRFYGYWDDRSSQYGYVHKLEIRFYLSDGNFEIYEILPPNSGIDSGRMFLRKIKIPKNFEKLACPGEEERLTVLNIWPTGFLKGRYIVDPIGAVSTTLKYYKENDLAIGVVLNVFGRKVVLTDCDDFTKEYYKATYGIETFEKLQVPGDDVIIPTEGKQLPPWNGLGSYEDSEANCRKIIPEAPKKDIFKFLSKGRMGMDSHVLRFKAKMISVDSVNDDRTFIISYFLTDDQISVFERAARNSGFASQYFSSKREIFKPDQERFVSVKPETFQKEDLWVGNTLKLEGYKFKLVNADEYCLRYMELHNQEFPKSNAKLILDKIRDKVRPVYKDFVAVCLELCVKGYGSSEAVLSFCNLKKTLMNLLEDDITEQEIITIARQFRLPEADHRFTKSQIVDACRTECIKKLWLGFERLAENLYYKDSGCTGFVPEKIALSLCKGAKIPIIDNFLKTIMSLVCKNECGEILIEDLLNFFDTRQGLCKPVTPFSYNKEFSDFSQLKDEYSYAWIDCNCFIKSIGLEEELAAEGHVNSQPAPTQTSTGPQ